MLHLLESVGTLQHCIGSVGGCILSWSPGSHHRYFPFLGLRTCHDMFPRVANHKTNVLSQSANPRGRRARKVLAKDPAPSIVVVSLP